MPHPETEDLRENVSGAIIGLQPLPPSSIASQGDGVVDTKVWFIDKTNTAPDVQRAYSETADQAFGGHYVENYGNYGCGAPLADQTFGPHRNGFRGMADEALPTRPPKPDLWDADYDGDTPRG